MTLRPQSGMFSARSTLTSATSVTAPAAAPRQGPRPPGVWPPAAGNADTAEAARRDRLEQVRIAHPERRLSAVADEDDPAERGEEAAEHVEDDREEPDVHTGEERGLRVVADREDAPAERRGAEHEGDGERDPGPEQQPGRDA